MRPLATWTGPSWAARHHTNFRPCLRRRQPYEKRTGRTKPARLWSMPSHAFRMRRGHGTRWPASPKHNENGAWRNGVGSAPSLWMTACHGHIHRLASRCANSSGRMRRSRCCSRRRNASSTKSRHGTDLARLAGRGSDGRKRNVTGVACWRSMTANGRPTSPWRARSGSRGAWTMRSKCCFRRRHASRTKPAHGTIWLGWRSRAAMGGLGAPLAPLPGDR